RAGFDEPGPVEGDAAIKPAGIRHGARHHKHVSDVTCVDDPGSSIAPLETIEMAISVQRHELRSCPQRDLRMILDSTNQVARHRLTQDILAHEEMDVPGRLRENHGSLSH